MNKIFCIGLAKTGTTSLYEAMVQLGFKSVHGFLEDENRKFEDYQFISDMPVQTRFEALDQRFPGSKFIYTFRQKESWFKSCERFFSQHHPPEKMTSITLRYRIEQFGITGFDKKIFSRVYDEHKVRVENYFEDRPDDFLKMDICGGDSWNKLCDFLELPLPDKNIPFPAKNQAGQKRKFSSFLVPKIIKDKFFL